MKCVRFNLQNTKKGCIFVLLLFIFFPAVEYWASPGCDSGINAELRSGKRVFSLWHLDSKGKLLTAISQEFLYASDCMLVPHNQGGAQQLLDGSGGCFPFGLLSLPRVSAFLLQTCPYDTCVLPFACAKWLAANIVDNLLSWRSHLSHWLLWRLKWNRKMFCCFFL